MEKYRHCQISFSLHTFESAMTIIILIEYYASPNSTNFHLNFGTYLPAMLVLLVYGLLTALQTFTMFYSGSEESERKVSIVLTVLRTLLMAVSLVLLLTQDGSEV